MNPPVIDRRRFVGLPRYGYANNRVDADHGRAALLDNEAIAVRDAHNALIAESGTVVRGALLLRDYPRVDAGRVVRRRRRGRPRST